MSRQPSVQDIAQEFGGTHEPSYKPSASQIANEFGGSISSDKPGLLHQIGQYLAQIPGQAVGTVQQFRQDPLGSAKTFGLSALEEGGRESKNIASLPFEASHHLFGTSFNPYKEMKTQLLSQQAEQQPAAFMGHLTGGAGEQAMMMALTGGSGNEAILPSFVRAPATAATAGFATADPGERLKSAAVGGLLGAAGEGLVRGSAALKGAASGRSLVGNRILGHLKRSMERGETLSPEDAAQNLAQNFTSDSGEPLAVDIGTATNNPALRGTYQALKYVPGSGVRSSLNILKHQLVDKDIVNVQNQIGAMNALPDIQDLSPNHLNSLADEIPDRRNITTNLSDAIKSQLKERKAISNNLYSPVNAAKDLRIDKLPTDDFMPNYSGAARELAVNRDNLIDVFGDDKDLAASVRNEIDKASNVADKGRDVPLTLGESMQRSQNLGRLGRVAYKRNNLNEYRLLSNLKTGLDTDINSHLHDSGNADLANQWQKASEDYRDNVVPYLSGGNIQKAALGRAIPKADSLAKELFQPDNQTVYEHSPDSIKKASLYQVITGGKGTAEGMSNLTADQIGKKYASIPIDTKVRAAQFSPETDRLFEDIPQHLKNEGTLKALHQNLQDLKKTKYGLNTESSNTAANLIGAAKGIGAAGVGYLHPAFAALSAMSIPAFRNLGKTLKDPRLLQAYIKGEKLTPSFVEGLTRPTTARSQIPISILAAQLAKQNRQQGGQ